MIRRDLLFPLSAVVLALALAWLYWQDAPLRIGLSLDALHHLAAVRELAKGEFPPAHNLVAGSTPQGHYGPYLVLLALVVRVTSLDPRVVLYAAGMVNLIAHVLLFRMLVLRLAGPDPARFAGLAAVLLWGPWPALEMEWPTLGWPGTTSLADPQNFFYPNQAGLLLLMGVLLLLLPPPDSRPPRAVRLGLALLMTAVLIATHPLTALALAFCLAALILSELLRRRARPARVASLAALPLAGLLLASLWPYYPVPGLLKAFQEPAFAGLRRTPSRPTQARAPEPSRWRRSAPAPSRLSPTVPMLDIFGPAIVGLPGLAWLAWRGTPFPLVWFLAWTAVAIPRVVPLHERFAFFAAIPLQLGATLVLDTLFRRGRAGAMLAAAALLAGVFSAALRLEPFLEREVPDLSFLERVTPEHAVILSDPATSNGAAGLAGRKVVCPEHPDLFLILEGGARRMQDVRVFLQPGTEPARRDAILRRWDATHVLLDRFQTRLRLPYPVAYEGEGYTLYDVQAITATENGATRAQRHRE
jgi:hypothetical protein